MNIGLVAHSFQFVHHGKLHHAAISHEALQDFFDGMGRPLEDVYRSNADTINHKAAQILDSGQVRSPFLLTTLDFQDSRA